jgi:hypothetical protein
MKEVRDLLRTAVVEDGDIALLQIGDGLAVLVDGDQVDVDRPGIGSQRESRTGRGIRSRCRVAVAGERRQAVGRPDRDFLFGLPCG